MNICYIKLVMSLFILCNCSFIWSKKILLTGGAGFIGSCLVKTLAEQAGKCRITILGHLRKAGQVAVDRVL